MLGCPLPEIEPTDEKQNISALVRRVQELGLLVITLPHADVRTAGFDCLGRSSHECQVAQRISLKEPLRQRNRQILWIEGSSGDLGCGRVR
jgi:hypothetical protein